MTDSIESTAGKTALITGAARRIGAVIAEALHGAGMNVVLHYRGSSAEARKLASRFNQLRPASAMTVQADLLQIDRLPDLIRRAASEWGSLDVLINNASTFYPTPLGEITEQAWDELIGTNLKAPLFLAQAAARDLAIQSGCIVNIVDIHAERPLKGYTVYSIAKAGLVMLTRSLAREMAPAVRVNAVAPGAILWPEAEGVQAQILERVALKRQGSPQDIARTVVFLVRDAGYITGQVITVDGGRTLSN